MRHSLSAQIRDRLLISRLDTDGCRRVWHIRPKVIGLSRQFRLGHSVVKQWSQKTEKGLQSLASPCFVWPARIPEQKAQDPPRKVPGAHGPTDPLEEAGEEGSPLLSQRRERPPSLSVAGDAAQMPASSLLRARPRTARASAIRKCTRLAKAISGTSE